MSQPPPDRRPLWAPWRMQYILGPRTPGCFLCQKAASPAEDVVNRVIARGELCYVLLNEYPYNPGHLLIAPLRHVANLSALTPAERGEMLELLAQAQRVLDQAMHPEGLNVGCNIGKAAGAAIEDHLHWHVVPRWVGDTNFMPVLGEVDCVPQALEATTAFLRQAWANLAVPA